MPNDDIQTALDTAALDLLRSGIEALPSEVDGIDLTQTRQTALIQLEQLLTSVKILNKLSN
ncbi:hypothetical protein M3484_09545 [Pseudomonas sp. GX19020]|uniref:hypothetical protein n=1 Tax=Pseudomonas sp. GX19020 TaxID=2942277 RepID=UPI002019070B|nr:hypothetical protein [Pseudomonas sp. GX19020]MCL4066816.1 hypothetical protein [Pseudomonas sp. GX19020]